MSQAFSPPGQGGGAPRCATPGKTHAAAEWMWVCGYCRRRAQLRSLYAPGRVLRLGRVCAELSGMSLLLYTTPCSVCWIPTLAITFHNIVSAIFRDNMRYLAISGDIWRYLAILGDIWRYLAISGDIWRFCPIFRASAPFATPQIHGARTARPRREARPIDRPCDRA